METLAELAAHDPVFVATSFLRVDLATTIRFKRDELVGILTARRCEGMVVKPLDWNLRGAHGMGSTGAQSAWTRVFAFDLRAGISRARQFATFESRNLGAKRSLATRESALGVEALERFVRGEGLRRVHECVFGVLALDSEPSMRV
jgi:protein phosphatase